MEQMPNDVLESLMQAIHNEANKRELFRFNNWLLSCDSSFYDAVKECLISAGMFNPQTDKLTISCKSEEPYRFDVKVVKPIYKFDFTIERPQGDKNE